jgi:antitoxin (DNA-binding transcriptional repressor) of toxin-antitoxin stability system|tara:strand:+ start:567 stop:740 length:174 start_codon:yes stop_codon:yes gene_type:complete
MEIFTVKEFQDNWDELIERVEKGEHLGIVNDDGHTAVMMPADDELLKMYRDNNNEGA